MRAQAKNIYKLYQGIVDLKCENNSHLICFIKAL